MASSAELIDLLKEYQKHLPDSKEGIVIKTNIIEKLSKSYWWKTYISNLFPEEVKKNKAEYQQELKAKLEVHLNKSNDCSKLAKFIINDAIFLINKYEKLLVTDELINTLAIAVKKTAADSEKQRKEAVQRLMKATDVRNAYKRKGLGAKFNLSPRDYQEAFKQAKQESLLYIVTKIDNYDETKDFMVLVNYWIPKKFIDAAMQILGLKKSQSSRAEEDRILIYPEDPTSEIFANKLGKDDDKWAGDRRSQEIKQAILQDPEFRKPVRRNRPDKTFADILIAKYWLGKTYKDLVQEWNIPRGTIQRCYEDEMARLKPYLAKLLQD